MRLLLHWSTKPECFLVFDPSVDHQWFMPTVLVSTKSHGSLPRTNVRDLSVDHFLRVWSDLNSRLWMLNAMTLRALYFTCLPFISIKIKFSSVRTIKHVQPRKMQLMASDTCCSEGWNWVSPKTLVLSWCICRFNAGSICHCKDHAS